MSLQPGPLGQSMPGSYEPRHFSSGSHSLSSSSISTVKATEKTGTPNGYSSVGMGDSSRGSLELDDALDEPFIHNSDGSSANVEENVRHRAKNQTNGVVLQQTPTSIAAYAPDHDAQWRLQGGVPPQASHNIPSQVERPDKRNMRRSSSPSSQSHEIRAEGLSGRPHEGVVPRRIRSISEREKKIMLSKALQKANDAVLLDNAQNYEDAISAYNEACSLLGHVLGRTAGEEDKVKLSAIRNTYANRIVELQRLGLSRARATSQGSSSGPSSAETSFHGLDGTVDYGDMSPVLNSANLIRTAPQTKPGLSNTYGIETVRPSSRAHNAPQPLPGFQSQTSPISAAIHTDGISHDHPWALDPTFETSSRTLEHGYSSPNSSKQPYLTAGGQIEHGLMNERGSTNDHTHRLQLVRSNSINKQPRREIGNKQASSPNSSPHHSVSSFEGLHRRRLHTRADSGATEAAFDAALDAAVEAAYGEGYEPYDDRRSDWAIGPPATVWVNPVPALSTQHQIGRQNVDPRANSGSATGPFISRFPDVQEGDSDDEERVLEELTKGFGLRDLKLEPPVHVTVPRGSDSSGFSNTTFGSSATSSMTAGTSLSTVDEAVLVSGSRKYQYINGAASSSAPAPPPQGPLPLPPAFAMSQNRSAGQGVALETFSVQERRGPGPHPRKLTIETAIDPALGINGYSAESHSVPSTGRSQYASPVTPEKSDSRVLRPEKLLPLATSPQGASSQGLSRQISPSFVLRSPLGPNYGKPSGIQVSPEGYTRASPQSGSPANHYFGSKTYDRSHVKKNLSSMSLKHKPVLTSTSEDVYTSQEAMATSTFALTPFSTIINSSKSSVPTTAQTPPFRGRIGYFDDAAQVANKAVSQKPLSIPPRPLEPCPESPMLRPLWLMRCLYEVVTHPKGGYLSEKLFVPREVWRLKKVKLKHIDDKIINMQLLTDALLKLGALNLLNTDAILHEMQSLEHVLDQAQASLSRKLGGDVGPHTVSSMFKEASASAGDLSPASTAESYQREHKSGMSMMASWRKLRGKAPTTHEAIGMGSVSSRDSRQASDFSLPSVPMTSINGVTSSRQYARRGATDYRGEGPNAGYMSAVAKLCSAVQVLDQIARQIEDPDLKHPSPTRMGLELSVRHAAEFFGFYVCRFILQDITILVNKLLKRSTEWVLV